MNSLSRSFIQFTRELRPKEKMLQNTYTELQSSSDNGFLRIWTYCQTQTWSYILTPECLSPWTNTGCLSINDSVNEDSERPSSSGENSIPNSSPAWKLSPRVIRPVRVHCSVSKKRLWMAKTHSSSSCQPSAIKATTEVTGAEGAASTQAPVSTSAATWVTKDPQRSGPSPEELFLRLLQNLVTLIILMIHRCHTQAHLSLQSEPLVQAKNWYIMAKNWYIMEEVALQARARILQNLR